MVIINGNTITLFYQGEVYTKQATEEEITVASIHAQAKDYEEIINYLFPTHKKLLNKGFWEEDGSLYYKNIKVSIPQVLANKFLETEGDEFQRLIKFWGWLSLNPNPRTRENLYGWVEKNGIQLTNGGLMILYRRVVKVKPRETNIGKFVDGTYKKIREKKKSTNVDVYLDKDNYLYTSNVYYGDTLIGNLKQLYLELEMPVEIYTDAHTGKERYKIGEESRMPRDKGDESDASCSRGYHLASTHYNFSGFGDTPIVAVVNPCDIFNSVDDFTKIRTAAFTPVAVLNSDCEWIDDPEVHKRIDSCYDASVDRLEILLSQANFEDFKKHEVLANEWNLAVGFETVLKILN